MEQEEVCATEGMNASVKRVGEQGGHYWTYLGASASVFLNSFLSGGFTVCTSVLHSFPPFTAVSFGPESQQ